jgi:hypothetical protein
VEGSLAARPCRVGPVAPTQITGAAMLLSTRRGSPSLSETRPPTEAAYLQSGHDAVSFGRSSGLDVILANFILAPQRGQCGGAGVCSLTFSTTSGFTRAWL